MFINKKFDILSVSRVLHKSKCAFLPIMGICDNKFKVYVRLPVDINEELDIKNLHPDIETVKLPRQKPRRWCFVIFKDEETQTKVTAHLKKQKINGKKIVVKDFQKRQYIKKKSHISKRKLQEKAKAPIHLLD